MRCPDCNKMASNEPEIESDDLNVENDGAGGAHIDGTVEYILNSACCSTELARASMEVDFDIEAADIKHKPECVAVTSKNGEKEDALKDLDFTIDGSAEPDERFQTTDSKGKPIKNYRFQKKFYVAQISGDVTCEACGENTSFETSVEEQASFFEPSN